MCVKRGSPRLPGRLGKGQVWARAGRAPRIPDAGAVACRGRDPGPLSCRGDCRDQHAVVGTAVGLTVSRELRASLLYVLEPELSPVKWEKGWEDPRRAGGRRAGPSRAVPTCRCQETSLPRAAWGRVSSLPGAPPPSAAGPHLPPCPASLGHEWGREWGSDAMGPSAASCRKCTCICAECSATCAWRGGPGASAPVLAHSPHKEM